MTIINLPDAVLPKLICPECHTPLIEKDENILLCQTCMSEYGLSDAGSIDLKLKNSKKKCLEFSIGEKSDSLPQASKGYFEENVTPQILIDSDIIPHHLSSELLSFFPKLTVPNNLVLDLGCGDAVHKSVCENAGYAYVGMDYSNPKAPILGDAHAMPFQDQSFDFVLSIAVFEHIQYPFIVIREISRVLKNGGVFIGTVSFLEPFHGNSFHHFTGLGVGNLLSYGGFEVVQLAPNKDWQVFDAQARMAAWTIFPGLPSPIARSIIRFPQKLSDGWSFIYKKFRGEKELKRNASITAGSFSFVARKPS